MATETKGPYTVEPWQTYKGKRRWFVRDPAGTVVSATAGALNQHRVEDMALALNAAYAAGRTSVIENVSASVIVNADLLAACEALAHEYDQTYDGTPSKAWSASMLQAAELARTAIAKAKGN